MGALAYVSLGCCRYGIHLELAFLHRSYHCRLKMNLPLANEPESEQVTCSKTSLISGMSQSTIAQADCDFRYLY